MSDRLSRQRLTRKADRGFQGYPIATIAWYGPDASRATKVVVGIKLKERGGMDSLEKWFVDEGDIRDDPVVGAAILGYLQGRGARTVVMSAGLLGCPHEKVIDYPLGASCPVCPYWAGRVRPI